VSAIILVLVAVRVLECNNERLAARPTFYLSTTVEVMRLSCCAREPNLTVSAMRC
jgi:hypothetical protein